MEQYFCISYVAQMYTLSLSLRNNIQTFGDQSFASISVSVSR